MCGICTGGTGEGKGHGIGVSLAREILLAHDGDLTFTTRTDGLTEFCARLPGIGPSQPSA